MVTTEHQYDGGKDEPSAKYVAQKSLILKVFTRTHRQTQTAVQLLYAATKWSVIIM